MLRNPFASKPAVPPALVDTLLVECEIPKTHADAVRALLPAPADPEADVAARTAARLKRQGA